MVQWRSVRLAVGIALGSMGLAVGATAQDLGKIKNLMQAEHYDQALDLLEVRVQAAPGDAEARFLQGVALVELERDGEALGVFERLTQDHPDLPEPYNNLAVLYAARGDHARARDALLEAIGTHPSYATAHENLGDIYAQMAGIAYNEALQLDVGNDAARAKLKLIDEMFPGQQLTGLPEDPASEGLSLVAAALPTPVPSPPALSAADSNRTAILSTLTSWAHAWSSQDVERYLGFYAADFVPADGSRRADWVQGRRTRLVRPSFIDVTLSNLDVALGGAGEARVAFTQSYRADTYQDEVRKRVTLNRSSGEWRITREQSQP